MSTITPNTPQRKPWQLLVAVLFHSSWAPCVRLLALTTLAVLGLALLTYVVSSSLTAATATGTLTAIATAIYECVKARRPRR